MKKKTFIFLMGAQKAGTSILHDLLNRSENCHFGFLKEYHIHDVSYFSILNDLRLSIRNKKNLKKALMRTMMKFIPLFYELYFLFISRNHLITGDFTPGHSVISPFKLKLILFKLKLFGFDPKIIFIMRDPYQRCLSMMNMLKRRNVLWSRGIDSNIGDEKILSSLYTTYECVSRTRYNYIIENIMRSAPSNQVLILINEQLNNSVKKINIFFNLNLPLNSFAEKKFHHIGKTNISKKLKSTIIYFYKDTYEYCFENYPETKQLWSSAFNILNKLS